MLNDDGWTQVRCTGSADCVTLKLGFRTDEKMRYAACKEPKVTSRICKVGKVPRREDRTEVACRQRESRSNTSLILPSRT